MVNKWRLNHPGGIIRGIGTQQFIITHNEILYQQLSASSFVRRIYDKRAFCFILEET